jgi:hypothetical protein
LVYSGGQNATLGTFTTTWNGSESLVENVDAQLEGTASYTSGHVNNMLVSANVNDLVMAESASGTKRLIGVMHYPPRPGILLY